MNQPQESPKQVITLDPQLITGLWKFIFVIVLGYIAVKAFPYISSALVLLLVSVLLTAILSPFVDILERRKIPRALSALIVLLVFLFTIALAFWFIIPMVREQAMAINELIQSQQPTELLETFQNWISEKLPAAASAEIQKIDFSGRINTFFSDFLSGSVSLLFNIAGMVSSLFIVLVITFLLMKDSRKITKSIVSLIPNRYFEPGLNLLDHIQTQLSNYIRGQLTDALVIGLLSIIGLWILDIKYFVFIGLIAGIANLIPYIGPVAGAIPAMLISIINNPGEPIMLVYIALMFAIVQMIDNSIVSPTVMSKSVNMHPISVIIIIIIGGSLMGAFGMLIAVPAAGIIKVTFEQVMWTLKHYKAI
ncbi:MAG: AI-2E family transporter [Candidatus Marinimicrobia bacterium]|nr:AI-2E family transporter [Candidatus Neomarinimicrobiota bacterium]MCF7830130.1 AI-2E family transporter [Candidatus Neomarinimicrobiota bacterium]MCF7882207.1 AI-2E family transporter [Candidatus Neomarinimicrobiota bacterium]